MCEEKFIVKSSRNKSVNDYEYGEIEGFGLSYLDTPVKADICYSDTNELIYENYDNLISYIENNLIPYNIIKKEEQENSFYYIRLRDILCLKLSEKENAFIINYLGKKGLFVIGFSTSLEGEFDNYICIRTKGHKNVSADLPLYTLSAQEEKELFMEYKKNPTIELKKEIALYNSRLVSAQCGIYSKIYNIDVDELYGYGMIGLLKAISLFDISLGNRFSTFAVYRIKSEILIGIKTLRGVPIKYNNESYNFCIALSKIEKENNSLINKNISITDDLISYLIKENIIKDNEETKKIIENWCNLINYFDIDELITSENEDIILYDAISDDNFKENLDIVPEITFINTLKSDVAKVLDTLDEKTKEIIKMRFGLYPYEESITLENVGEIYNVTRERIRQIESDGIKKLKVYHRRRILEDYY